MVAIIFRNLIKKIKFLRYRFQYLINYIIIGFFSVLLEVLIVKYTLSFGLPIIIKLIIGFAAGVMLAFILNAKLNFRVPKSKNRRTFFLFLTIAIIAFILNLSLIYVLREAISLSYTYLRFITAGMVFVLSYTAHRKITFDFVKNVGIAVYLNRGGNISEVYSKIKYYADFIHIDLIDSSFDKNAPEIDLSLIKEINKTWGLKKILHIMSKKPSLWIKKLNKNIDIIIFHLEIDEPVEEVIALSKKYNKKIGICLKTDSKIEDILKYIPKLDFVQVMGIDEIGKSGQYFNPNSLEIVKKLNELKKKYSFQIIFDGGVKPTNVGRINAKYIVSGSGILSSVDPIKSFLELKTSSRYRPIESEFKDYLIKEIKQMTENLEFIVSGNIVGSFSENKRMEGINDIDIVLIAENLTKQNFNKILEKFENLKKDAESKYGYKVIINPTLGPLKFNKNNVVFHLMIYDINSHIKHCKESPFTCFDWQKSRIFFKKPMLEIYKVRYLQPSNFFNSRRGLKEYLSEISSNRLSYREYKFNSNKIIEEKKYKIMEPRDRIEFSYHIIKFLILNFLKLYYRENKNYEFRDMLKIYFKIFPNNKEIHLNFIQKIIEEKEKRDFKESEDFIKETESFIRDFEKQFNDYFYKNSKEIIFLRHAETNLNKKNLFIGQKSNPSIITPKKDSINILKENFKDLELVFSSPSDRCRLSLNLITGKNPVIDNRLSEIDYGELDGKDFNYLSLNYPKIIEEWEFGNDPRFPNGENTHDVHKRMLSFINSIKNTQNKKVLVCAHNVFLKCLIGSYLKIPLKDWHRLNIPHFKPIKFIITKNNRFYIELNDELKEEIFKNI